MTKAARMVLQDAKFAIFKHSDDLQAEWFRISWFSIVGLLRSVGYVLDKVDSETSLSMKQAIRKKWEELQATRPEPQIFWGFIDYERNRILKNYRYGIDRHSIIIQNSDNRSVVIIGDCVKSQGGGCNPGPSLCSTISDGPYFGRHEKDVAWEAHNWWISYLDEVDNVAAKNSL